METRDRKKRLVRTKEEKRLLAEQSTRIASEQIERERMHRQEKSERLRALRLSQGEGPSA